MPFISTANAVEMKGTSLCRARTCPEKVYSGQVLTSFSHAPDRGHGIVRKGSVGGQATTALSAHNVFQVQRATPAPEFEDTEMNNLQIRFKNVVCAFIALGMLCAYASGQVAHVQGGGYKESVSTTISIVE